MKSETPIIIQFLLCVFIACTGFGHHSAEQFTGKWCWESKANKKHKPGTFKKYYLELLPGGLTYIGQGGDKKGYWRIEGKELILEDRSECYMDADGEFLKKHGFRLRKKGNWPNCGMQACGYTKPHTHQNQQQIFEIIEKSASKMTIKLVREKWGDQVSLEIQGSDELTYVLL